MQNPCLHATQVLTCNCWYSRIVPLTTHTLTLLPPADDGGGADNLAALHRSYKMMENDKVRYMEESKNIIKRQTQV